MPARRRPHPRVGRPEEDERGSADGRGEMGEPRVVAHEGPCLAVRANDRLDFFGTTVNVSARLQAQAGGSEIVVAEGLLDHRGVGEKVGKRPLRRFSANLKGIQAQQRLVAIDASTVPK